jgi:AcrR family transcriptional regulator
MRGKKRKIEELRTPYHHGNLRAALIQGGLELIEEKGVRALTLSEIGTRLGVSRAAPYRHFKDKADLLSAISQAGFVEFRRVLETAKQSAGSGFAAQMDAMAVAYVRFANEHRAQFEVMYAALLEGSSSADGSGRGFMLFKETIREGQQHDEVRPGDPALLAHVVWALVHGVSVLRMDWDDLEPEFSRFSGQVLRSGLSERLRPAVSPQAAD